MLQKLGDGMLREGPGQENTDVGGELPLAELQDPVDIELHRTSPLLLSGEGCCSQVLLLRALSLHTFPLVPIAAAMNSSMFLNSMEISLGAR